MTQLRKEIREYYNQDQEHDRLLSSRGQLEKIRTEQILAQFLPKPPAVVIDARA